MPAIHGSRIHWGLETNERVAKLTARIFVREPGISKRDAIEKAQVEAGIAPARRRRSDTVTTSDTFNRLYREALPKAREEYQAELLAQAQAAATKPLEADQPAPQAEPEPAAETSEPEAPSIAEVVMSAPFALIWERLGVEVAAFLQATVENRLVAIEAAVRTLGLHPVNGTPTQAFDSEGRVRAPRILVQGLLPDQFKTLEHRIGAAADLRSGDKRMVPGSVQADFAIVMAKFVSHGQQAHLQRVYGREKCFVAPGGLDSVTALVRQLVERHRRQALVATMGTPSAAVAH